MSLKNTQIACFRVGDSIYGVNIMDIKEIIRYQKVLPIPKAPDFVEGVINLREEAIPIISMRKRFGIELIDETKSMRIVILKVGAKDVGIVVDSVDKVLMIGEDDLKPPPGVTTGIESEYLSGVTWDGEELVMVLEMDRILSGKEKITLAEIGADEERTDEEKNSVAVEEEADL